MHEQVRARKLEPAFPKNRSDPDHIVTPSADAAFGQMIEIEFELAGKFFGVNREPAILPRSNRHISRESNGRGHHEAVVVVGVFADQVDAAGCAEDLRTDSECFFEENGEIDFVFHLSSSSASSRPNAHAKWILRIQYKRGVGI